jgi:colanic acid/amylovoran biosynthesis glycosyltransferase
MGGQSMKIAFILAEYPVLSETFIVRQIAGLVDKGHDVTVIAGNTDPTVADPLEGRTAIKKIRSQDRGRRGLRVLSGALEIARSPRQVRRLAKAISTRLPSAIADVILGGGQGFGKFDAIIAHFGPSGVRAMYLRAFGFVEGPVATVFHGLDMTERSLLAKYLPHYRRLFRETEALLPISALWKERLVGWGAPEEKVKIVRMGIDTDRFSKVGRSGEPDGPLRILTTARFVEKKGLEYAIQGVCQAKSPAHLSLIGYGPLEDQLRALATERPDRITFLGRCSHARVLELLEEADVFLLPSVTAANGDMEGIPVSLMEAMAAGVTVIATAHSGIPELIDSGSEGILVPERDSRAIADAIDAIADGRFDIAAMRAAARFKVESFYENKKLDDQFEGLLLALAAKRSG